MGFFDFMSSSSKRPKDMSDRELLRAIENAFDNGKSLATQANLIKEAKRRGLDIPQYYER